MGDADFKFILACCVIVLFWGSFNLALTSDRIDAQNKLSQTKQDTGIIASLTVTTEFLNPFSDEFQSDIFIINFFIFGVLLFGIVVVGLRYIRGV